MVIWGLILAIVIAFIAWLLFTTLIIRVDTDRGIYDLRLVGLMRMRFDLDDHGLVLHFYIPLYHFKVYPLRFSEKKKEDKPKKRSRSSSFSGRNILRVIRSFKVSVFQVKLDTDDYVLNAYLVPVSLFLQQRGLDTAVSFAGDSYVRLELKNSLWRMGKAFWGLGNN